MEWEKIFATHKTDKRYLNYIKNLCKIIGKDSPLNKMRKERASASQKKTMKPMKRCLTSLVIREMQIKTQ
jgi:hypothetical protein